MSEVLSAGAARRPLSRRAPPCLDVLPAVRTTFRRPSGQGDSTACGPATTMNNRPTAIMACCLLPAACCLLPDHEQRADDELDVVARGGGERGSRERPFRPAGAVAVAVAVAKDEATSVLSFTDPLAGEVRSEAAPLRYRGRATARRT
ncbi:hypothetical protein [Streptomyces sp. Tue6028]|uniref:hypothetical protein n=1 Tax=Streptomyces sp. Tue6028 TaxID=2036037 RepID=UPI003D710CED